MDKKTLDEALDKSRETFKLFELEFNEEMNKFIDSLNEEQREYLSLMQESTEGLLRLVNDLFSFSKITSGGMILEKESMSLQQVVLACMENFKSQAESN